MARSIDDGGHSSFYIDFCLGFLNSVIILLRFVNWTLIAGYLWLCSVTSFCWQNSYILSLFNTFLSLIYFRRVTFWDSNAVILPIDLLVAPCCRLCCFFKHRLIYFLICNKVYFWPVNLIYFSILAIIFAQLYGSSRMRMVFVLARSRLSFDLSESILNVRSSRGPRYSRICDFRLHYAFSSRLGSFCYCITVFPLRSLSIYYIISLSTTFIGFLCLGIIPPLV